jgi:short-subunit dehydrogenase
LAVSRALDTFGQLDVLVNNAGFSVLGAAEEFTRSEILGQFNINFVAAHSFIKSVLPHFRQRRNGHILNISSLLAFHATTNWSIYAASKAALTALSDALGDEIAPFGIKVTSVMPGPFKTNFWNIARTTGEQIEDYKHVRDARDKLLTTRPKGNAEKAAKLFVKVATDPKPPRWLFLGAYAIRAAGKKNERIVMEVAKWRDQAIATDD